MNLCTIEGCDRKHAAKGLCASHYYTQRNALSRAEVRAKVRVCAECGNEFSGRRPNAIFCSVSCKDRAHGAAKLTRDHETCEQCGTSLMGKRSHARFCSVACGDAWRNAQRKAEAKLVTIANRKPCRGCGGLITADRKSSARYCSEDCKIRSRRQETYNLSRSELDALLAQHGVCAICQTDDWGRKGPQVDHDHATGRVRGVLCLNCNNGLGRFKDDPARLLAAVEYLGSAEPI